MVEDQNTTVRKTEEAASGPTALASAAYHE